MTELLTTILHRPYVFAFLAAYLFLAWRLWGWKRTILWLVSGYLIAWASEYSSIHNGFPYGEYHYIYENLSGELLIGGVPFFDSLSYPFLIFAGYAMAKFIIRAWAPGKQKTGAQVLRCSGAILLGATFTMLLDVIIDPIATMGDKWFLGKIHWYAHPGWYFGVPFSNFAGWFVVSFAIIAVNVFFWRVFLVPRCLGAWVPEKTITAPERLSAWAPANKQTQGPRGPGAQGRLSWLYPGFYAGIALFNIAVTFLVGEWMLGLASSAVLAAIIAAAARPSMGLKTP